MIIAVLNPVEVLTSVRNCVQNCDDHGLLDFKIRSSIYETFHISLHNSSVGWNCSLKLSVLPLMTEALRYSFLILSSIFFFTVNLTQSKLMTGKSLNKLNTLKKRYSLSFFTKCSQFNYMFLLPFTINWRNLSSYWCWLYRGHPFERVSVCVIINFVTN